MLYSESDLNNYVTYATKRDGNKLLGNYNAKPGKYYLSVYKYGGGTGNYTENKIIISSRFYTNRCP